ncbi:MAG: beta-N-acetylhexosaminidase [Kiritimatiellia bacterium]
MRACLPLLAVALGWSFVADAVVPRPQSMTLTAGFCAAGTKPRELRDAAIAPEGYRLRVSSDAIEIAAADAAGAAYARETLRQLAAEYGAVPCGTIEDAPKYAWRGLMVDEARHFFGKAAIKDVLDRMARDKLNVFHWHLVDDQGWRIEIRRHPELVAAGARRPESVRYGDRPHWQPDGSYTFRMDGRPYGPHFYTQDDIREILAYAKARHIRVVPEIELPGHVRALLAAHPEFSCTGASLPRVPRTYWSIEDDVLCAGNDAAIRLLEEVFDEVCALFAESPVIHLGGDECPKQRWQTCAKCQARIRAQGLKDERALQAWLVSHFARYLAAKGRRAIGWDEILCGDVPRSVIAMAWRMPSPGHRDVLLPAEIAGRGFDLVATPKHPCYLDYRQELAFDPYAYYSDRTNSLDRCLAFDPAAGVAEKDRAHVLGGQGNCWTESTRDHAELVWKTWPRASALAEALWSGPGGELEDFRRRLAARARDDRALWAEIGKAEAEGWNVPVELPTAEARVVASFGGDTAVHRVERIAGEIWCAAQFAGDQLSASPACYAELYQSGYKGLLGGAYERTKLSSDGRMETRHLKVLFPGSSVSYGSLKPSDGQPKAVPARCELWQRPLSAVLRAPDDGATLRDNTPDLAWYAEDPLGVIVEWSQDPAFPTDASVRRFVADPTRFITVDAPLARGTWYWRVTTASGYVTPARRFEQTAAPTDDCTPPALSAAPRYLADAQGLYGFAVGADTVTVTAKLAGEPLDARFRGTRAGVKPPEAGWPTGVSRLELAAADAAGNVARAVTWVACAPGLPQVVWGGPGEPATIGGKPFLPKLIYTVENAEGFDRVQALGFNLVQSYARDHRLPTSADVQALDDLGTRGLKTMVAVNRAAIAGVDLDRVAQKIGAWLPRRELLAWYLFDEPDVHDVSPERLRRTAKLIAALDPTRPRLLTTYFTQLGAVKYADCCEVFLTQCYRKTAAEVVAKWDESRALFAACQPQVRHTLIVNPETAEELAEQVDYGLQHGCGIMLWAWYRIAKDPARIQTVERLGLVGRER